MITLRRLVVSRGVALLALGLLSACSTAPVPTLLSLPLPPPAQPAVPAVAAPAVLAASALRFITLRRVNIPEYLLTNAVRYRNADSTLAEWPNTAWAERLEVGLTNQLALLLRQALPSWTVCDSHCPSMPTGQVLIVNMAPLDYVRSAGQLRADVSWRITGPGSTPTPVFSGSSASSTGVSPDTPVGQAAAISTLLNQVAQDVARAVR
ncbi:ABC-type transport auxiliary lipoprotein family protein [Aquabacterium sp.]|uniref:PqiC family protein n=1 Tax=Aquabacterium sp. TaxID=1872578 RepID=UPI001999298F|nr:ABC-type transport auxiliary lipoprotein family protein [Aquabacterium sp.]MBC7698865.1 membrane integrity-associated transporter subunit PqiC [Aquabacterium sp.]